MDDPDAPNGDWFHWIVLNIPTTTQEIAENSVPEGSIEALTSFGKPGYGAPCPPSGAHRYRFTLYAVDAVLALDGSTQPQEAVQALNGHVLGVSQLVGRYQK